MGTITTTTNATPLIWPSNTLIERGIDGRLYALVKATTANTYEIWRSTDGGANWAVFLSFVRANVQEVGSIQVLRRPYNQLVICYRTNESSQDRIYIKTCSDLGASAPAWNNELLIGWAANGGVAGSIYTGMDQANVTITGQNHYVAVAVGSVLVGVGIGVSVFTAVGGSLATLQAKQVISGNWWWVKPPTTGRITPSIDIEHNGDGHTSNNPHLWVGFGRTNVYLQRCAWNGSGWNGPSSAPVQLNPVALTPAQDHITSRWDGQRFLTAIPDPVSTSAVTILERNRSNTTTTIRTSPAHPQGVVRNCTLSYNSVNGDIRVFAVGTTTAVLYFIDFARATGLWTTWATVTATAILGATGNNYSVRRGTDSTARYDVATAHATPTPNTLVSTHQTVTYTPNVPSWDTSSMGRVSGDPADVNNVLFLDWTFSDPDPADTQSAYAVSRQIGAGALAYWRASDSTWQPAEVQNASASSFINVNPVWQPASDAATTFRAKVWDSGNAPSNGYGPPLVVVPSTVVNPAITAPTPAQVLVNDTMTATWTAAEQTAYRLRLHQMLTGDAFGRTVAAGGVGSADYGGAYSISGGTSTDYSVSSGAMRLAQTSLANREVRLTPPVLSADVDIVVSFSINQTPTGAAIENAVRVRYTDANNYVAFRWFVTQANVVTVNIDSRIGGVSTNTSFPTVVGLSAASQIMLRMRAKGDQLMIRAWSGSSAMAEPVNVWHATLTATQFQVGTMYGFDSGINTGNTNVGLVAAWDFAFIRAIEPVYDSGFKSGADTSVTPPTRLPDLSAWTLGVTTKNLEGLPSTEQVVGFTVDYIEPAIPTITATPIVALGVIRVAITNPVPSGGQPALADQALYRRVAGDGSAGVVLSTGLVDSAVYDDYRAVSGAVYEYRVLARGVNGTTIFSAWTA